MKTDAQISPSSSSAELSIINSISSICMKLQAAMAKPDVFDNFLAICLIWLMTSLGGFLVVFWQKELYIP